MAILCRVWRKCIDMGLRKYTISVERLTLPELSSSSVSEWTAQVETECLYGALYTYVQGSPVLVRTSQTGNWSATLWPPRYLFYLPALPWSYFRLRPGGGGGFGASFKNVGSFYFLGAFAKLRKATISFVISLCPSVWNNSALTGRILMRFDVKVFRTCIERVQVSLKSDKNNGYFTWSCSHIYDNISLKSSWNEKWRRQKL
jgi:hypothetical protein